MEQHPIPQQISSYQFRLVGDMTLKQFFQLAGGIAAGFFFYSLPILGIVKWPFAIVSVILGVALAFLPLEERPLERWIFAFFKAIYSPTIFTWEKSSGGIKYFQDEPAGATADVTSEQNIALEKYMHTAPAESPFKKFEDAEKNFFSMLTGIFAGAGPADKTPVPIPPAAVPQAVQTVNPVIKTDDTPQAAVQEEKKLEIPAVPMVKVTVEKPKMVVEEKRAVSAPEATKVSPVIMGDEFISTHQAQFSVDAAPPNPPTSPNIAVGQIVDESRHIVDGAIIEIKDISGRPIRALRSNKAGHFVIITPLDNGQYEILTEKDGYAFTPVSFEAKGEIIPPILVQGRKAPVSWELNQESGIVNQTYAKQN